MPADFELISEICSADVEELEIKEKSYGDSWKRRGGVGAFMMLARKWDRIENICEEGGYDVLGIASEEITAGVDNGILDDVRDLRRYLLLVEQEAINRAQSVNTRVPGSRVIEEPGSAYVNQDPDIPPRPHKYT